MSTFIAQYPGACAECGGDVKGQEATFNGDNEIMHARCPETEVEAPRGVPLCQRCFCYHNGECS